MLATLREHLPKNLGEVQLSEHEAELLLAISQSLSQMQWQRYHALVAKRRAEQLSDEEHEELISLSNALEDDLASRIFCE
jgi:hypothetical protein